MGIQKPKKPTREEIVAHGVALYKSEKGVDARDMLTTEEDADILVALHAVEGRRIVKEKIDARMRSLKIPVPGAAKVKAEEAAKAGLEEAKSVFAGIEGVSVESVTSTVEMSDGTKASVTEKVKRGPRYVEKPEGGIRPKRNRKVKADDTTAPDGDAKATPEPPALDAELTEHTFDIAHDAVEGEDAAEVAADVEAAVDAVTGTKKKRSKKVPKAKQPSFGHDEVTAGTEKWGEMSICTRCGANKPITWRRMGNGTIRPQAQCGSCRSKK